MWVQMPQELGKMSLDTVGTAAFGYVAPGLCACCRVLAIPISNDSHHLMCPSHKQPAICSWTENANGNQECPLLKSALSLQELFTSTTPHRNALLLAKPLPVFISHFDFALESFES